jgi:hypothetical protein
MSLYQNLATAAGGVMVSLGSMGALIPLPVDCKAAIANQSTAQVSAVCGMLASDAVMVVVIFMGGVILFFTSPLKARFVKKRESDRRGKAARWPSDWRPD